MKYFLVFSVLMLVKFEVFANGYVENAKVAHITTRASGKVIVMFDREISTPADCASNYRSHFSFDSKSDRDSANNILSNLMFAYAAGKDIDAKGKGACDESEAVELLNWVRVKN